MFKDWLYFKNEYEKHHDAMMLDGYSWNEDGLLIELRSLSDKRYKIHFHVNVEIVKIEYNSGSDLTTQDIDDDYIQKSGAIPPCIGFYITNESELVHRVKEIDMFQSNIYDNKEYLHYIMTTEDFRIDIVSTLPPTINSTV